MIIIFAMRVSPLGRMAMVKVFPRNMCLGSLPQVWPLDHMSGHTHGCSLEQDVNKDIICDALINRSLAFGTLDLGDPGLGGPLGARTSPGQVWTTSPGLG